VSSGLIVDDDVSGVDKLALWDRENNGYYYQLIELWLYSSESDVFQFYNRFVDMVKHDWLDFV